MNILYTLDAGNPGGMEKHVLELVTGMVANGHKVYVFCRQGEITEWYENAGAKVTVTKVNFDIDPVYILKLYQFIKKNKIDLVHAHELKAVGNSMLACSLAGTKLITNIHTPFSQWQIPKYKRKIYEYFYTLALKFFSNAEIAVSETTKQIKINEGFGVNPNKIKVILNGVDSKVFDISNEKRTEYKAKIISAYFNRSDTETVFLFGNLSRVSEEKGHPVLVEAFSKFLEYKNVDKDNTLLLIAGGGPKEQELQQKITNLKLQSNIAITGRFPEEQKSHFFGSFDAFLFPTLAEGYGIVLVEALASGLPVICSNLPVLQEVGGSAVFSYFETANPDDLAEKMYNLYLKRGNLSKIVQNSLERMNSLYSLEKFISSYEELYKEIIREN